MTAPLKILFMGSPQIAIPSLKALLGTEEKVLGVISQPDRPAGRGRELTAPAVAAFAKASNIPLLQPERIRGNSAFLEEIEKLAPDLVVVVAFGQILPAEFLKIPPHGTLNVHFSLLPKYRGAAPLQWALINGEEETGVTTFFLNEKVDAGPILMQRKVMIHEEDNYEILGHRLAVVGAELLLETIEHLKAKDLDPLPQNEREATHAPLLKKQDGEIDWRRKSKLILGQIRGMTPWPGAYTSRDGKRLKIHHADLLPYRKAGQAGEILEISDEGIEVSCGQGGLLITELQIEGGRKLSAQDFLKGHALSVGEKLGS